MRWFSSGYFIARRTPPGSVLLPCPPHFFSISDCLSEFVPDLWAFAWTDVGPTERAASAEAFGLDKHGLDRLIRWTTDAFERGYIGFANTFFSADQARAFRAELLPPNVDVAIFGVSLPGDLARCLLAHTEPMAGHGEPGVRAALRRAQSPDQRGRLLGFEVAGFDAGGFHSYFCNALDEVFRTELGAIANSEGYFDDEQVARACAELAGSERIGAEPGLWLPWATRLYDVPV